MMKKLLLGSTALVAGGLMAAPAMAADPIKMGVGGYWTGYVLAGSIDSVYALDGSTLDFKGLNLIYEGEIHFIGQTKLDNGTTVGLTVELEAHNPSQTSNGTATTAGAGQTAGAPLSQAAQIDESFLFAFGDWGRVEFGSRDPGSYRMFYGTPSALIGWGFVQHNHQWNAVGASNKSVRAGYGYNIGAQWQDANRITYYTPRFAGFQLGLSYAPKLQQQSAAGTLSGGQLAGACGYNNGVNSSNCPVNDYQYQDQFDIGANYLNKFGDITVALHGAFAYATFNPGYRANGAASLTSGSNRYNWKQWVIGAQLGFAGFTFGAAMGYDNNGLGANYYTGVDNDTRYYTAGVMYETGPWQISAGWGGNRNSNGNGSGFIGSFTSGTSVANSVAATSTAAAFGTNPNTGALSFGAETTDKFEVGANYALGPGVKLVGGFMYYNISGPSNAVNGNSWAFIFGMDFRF
jgi:outer membrane protein OmpU